MSLPAEDLRPAARAPLIDGVVFTLGGVRTGAKRAIPIGLSIFTYGLVFGVLSGQAGLSTAEALLMSGLVYAGASQFVALGLWAQPLPVLAIVITTLIVNLRHVLMGAALGPWFLKLPPLKAYGTLFFMSDESWALTMAEFAKGSRDAGFLLGSGFVAFIAWLSATLVGRTLGSALGDPARWGLDFAFTAVFIALLAGLWRGKHDLLPWIVAGAVAVAASIWLPGKWYIILGGLAGSIAGALRRDG